MTKITKGVPWYHQFFDHCLDLIYRPKQPNFGPICPIVAWNAWVDPVCVAGQLRWCFKRVASDCAFRNDKGGRGSNKSKINIDMVFGRPLIYSWQYHLFWIIVLIKILPCLNDMDGIRGWLENCQCNARHINHSLHWNKPQTLRCALYWYMKSSKLLAIWKYDQYFSWQILCKIWYALCLHNSDTRLK